MPVTHASLANAKYVSFTTFRKDGTPVSTPVWFAPLGDRFVFMSNDNVGKTKRLARDSRVEVRACDVRGRVEEGTPTFTGQASARAAVEKKYGLLAKGFALASLVGKVIPALRPAPRAAIIVTLD